MVRRLLINLDATDNGRTGHKAAYNNAAIQLEQRLCASLDMSLHCAE